MMKSLLVLTCPLLALAGEVPLGFEEMVNAMTEEDADTDGATRNLFFDKIFGVKEEKEEEAGTVGLGGICGNRNKCIDGLECTESGAPYKICLPMQCVQAVVDAHNEAYVVGEGPKPFEEFAMNVFEGAGVSPFAFENGMEGEVLNHTTVDGGKDFMLAHPFDVIKSDVRRDLMASLEREAKKDALHLDLLQEKVQECFNSFTNPPAAEDESESPGDDGSRNLQDDTTQCLTLPGFFVEGAALFQFVYGMGIWDLGNDTSIVFHDFCLGGGPTAGAGAGFLLQLWSLTGGIPIEDRLEKYAGIDVRSPDYDPYQFVPLPFPAIMFDLDAALGPGLGIAYNTIGFFCHRLWLKFYLGAGGGLAFSICVIGIGACQG